MYLTLNLEEFSFLSRPALRTFLIFNVCGQFFENLKNFEAPGKKIKVVENWTGIIYMYLTLNLEDFFSLSHSTLRIFLKFHLCGQFIEKLKNKLPDDKT